MEVSFEQVEKWINRPLIEPSVADNLRRILADAKNEEARNQKAMAHNQTCTADVELLPYENSAYLSLAENVDRMMMDGKCGSEPINGRRYTLEPSRWAAIKLLPWTALHALKGLGWRRWAELALTFLLILAGCITIGSVILLAAGDVTHHFGPPKPPPLW
jgi:hypothetical protein